MDAVYPVLILDGIVFKIREKGCVNNKAAYVAMGIGVAGTKDVLGIWIDQSEGAKFCLGVLTELKNRGVHDILIACLDGLKGFPDPIKTVFPKATVQTCIVHMIRASMRFVSWKDRKKIVKDLRPSYTAATRSEAEAALDAFEVAWGTTNPQAVKTWRANWERVGERSGSATAPAVERDTGALIVSIEFRRGTRHRHADGVFSWNRGRGRPLVAVRTPSLSAEADDQQREEPNCPDGCDQQWHEDPLPAMGEPSLEDSPPRSLGVDVGDRLSAYRARLHRLPAAIGVVGSQGQELVSIELVALAFEFVGVNNRSLSRLSARHELTRHDKGRDLHPVLGSAGLQDFTRPDQHRHHSADDEEQREYSKRQARPESFDPPRDVTVDAWWHGFGSGGGHSMTLARGVRWHKGAGVYR